MRLLDEQFMETPFYGSRQMTRHFQRQGYEVGRERIRRLMRRLALQAIYQAPRTSKPHPDHQSVPLSFKGSRDQSEQSGVVRRHHVHPDAKRFFVFGGHHGLAQPQSAVVEVIQ